MPEIKINLDKKIASKINFNAPYVELNTIFRSLKLESTVIYRSRHLETYTKTKERQKNSFLTYFQ